MRSEQLSPVGPAARPRISDAKSCRQWLETVPLTNVAAAHADILVQVELLNQETLPAMERLKVLELLREPITELQESLSKKFAGKPIPLDNAELSVWKKANNLWQGLGQGYRLCLDACQAGDAEIASYFAFICHRILRTLAQQMLTYHYAYQPLPEELWRQLHKYYSLAEERGAARQAVKDPINPMMDLSSAESAYVSALLVSLADPYHLTARQLALLDRWLNKWAARVSIGREAPPPLQADFKIATITVDLARPSGASLLREFGLPNTGRYLDTNQLAVTLLKRIRHLRKGGSAADLDLGEECTQATCESFLSMVYQQWCEPLPLRTYDRRPGTAKAQITFTMGGIHFYCNGEKLIKQPGQVESLNWREMQDMHLFGRVTSTTAKQHASQLGFAMESWRIVDESALGFRLAADGMHAARTAHGHVIGIRPPDAKNFALGHIRWLRYAANGELQIGVRTFPGIPLPIGVRPPVLINTIPGKYQPAFLLPEIPALHEPATLILPIGWFARDKRLDILIEENLTVRLLQLVEKGADFERVTFTTN